MGCEHFIARNEQELIQACSLKLNPEPYKLNSEALCLNYFTFGQTGLDMEDIKLGDC